MRRIVCMTLAVVLILSVCATGALAAGDGQCLRYDIWRRCYVNQDDCSNAVCPDDSGNGVCSDDPERPCFEDADQDGECDNRSDCVRQEKETCNRNGSPMRNHGAGRQHGRCHRGRK